MTSKNSFFNILKLSISRSVWAFAASCMALFFAMPVYTALTISTLESRARYDIMLTEALPRLFRESVFGGSNFLLLIATVCLAFLIALNRFSYLFSRQQIDLFHSLPAKRSELFITNYIGGVIGFVIPYVISVAISLIIAGAYSLVDGTLLVYAAASVGLTILGFLAVYALGILAVCMTGNLAVSVLAMLVFTFYFPLCKFLVTILMDRFFRTYMTYGSDYIVTKLSPVFSYFTCGMQLGGTNPVPDVRIPDLVTLILYAVIITALDVILFNIRKSEAAGRSMAFNRSKRIIAIMLTVPVSLYGALAFEGIANTGTKINYVWFVFGAAVLIIIAHIIIQGVYYCDFRSVLKNLECPAVSAVLAALIVIVLAADITGYDNYIPSADKLDSAAISSYSMQGNLNYYNFDSNPDEYGSYNFWKDTTDHRFNSMRITDTALLQELAQLGNEGSKQYEEFCILDENSMPDGEELVDNGSGDIYSRYCNISVQYTMKSGKKIYRNYNIDFNEHIDLYNRIYTDKAYKEGVFTILTQPMADGDTLKLSDNGGDISIEMLSDAQKNDLLDTYCRELLSQDVYSLRDSIPVAEIYMEKSIQEGVSLSTYNYNEGYIYPEFTDTLELIKSFGIELNKTFAIENIQSIDVTDYSSEAYESGDSTKTYTDVQSMQAILDAAVPSNYASLDDYFHHLENVDTTVNFITPDSNNSKFGYMVFETGTIPEFVKNDLGLSE